MTPRCARCNRRFIGNSCEVANYPSSPFSEDENGKVICRACTLELWGGEEAFQDDAVDTVISISAIHLAEKKMMNG